MKWAKFSSSGGRDAFADKLLSLPSDYWAQIDVYVPSSTLTACNGELYDYTAFLLSILDGSTHHERDAIYGYRDSGVWKWSTDDGSDLVTGLTPDTTHTLKVHWDGTDATWYADGVAFAPHTVTNPTGGIRVGGYLSEGCICEWYFVTNVKVGTSDGGTDIFSEDFSGGDFSAFDSTSGDCFVVDSPSDCVPPSLAASPGRGCFGDTITVTGSGFAADSPLSGNVDGLYPFDISSSSDGSGDVSFTFEIPPAEDACRSCTITITITDSEGNAGTFDLKLCCPRAGDTFDAAATQYLPEVSGTVLDYIHHDGNHYVLIAGSDVVSEPGSLYNSSFPPDPTSHAATIYVIPDGGGSATSFPVDTDICFKFCSGLFDELGCRGWFHVHFGFEAWGFVLRDAKFASDGTNLWLAVLSDATVQYPYLSSEGECCPPDDPIHCVYYPGQTEQFIDLSTLTSGFTDFYQCSGTIPSNYKRWVRTDSGIGPAPSPWSDGGEKASGHWTAPRLRMYSVSTSAATDIGHIDSLYYPGIRDEWATAPDAYNKMQDSKLLSGLSVAASESEDGVCHVVWAEGGADGPLYAAWDYNPANLDYRINYSKWDTGAIVSQSDLWHSNIDRTSWYFDYDTGGGVKHFGFTWPTTTELVGGWSDVFQVDNDGGSPVLFLAPAATIVNTSPPNGDPDPSGNPWLDNQPDYPDPASFAAYDISSGSPTLMQSLDPALLPTAEETRSGGSPRGPVTLIDYSFGDGFSPLQGLAVSLPYADPLLSGTPVYLIALSLRDEAGDALTTCMYRIPVDLSATFDYLDGIRAVNYSIGAPPPYSVGYRRFWSDEHGVWVPGGWHLDRECAPTWQQYQVSTAYGLQFAIVGPPFYWDGGDYVYSVMIGHSVASPGYYKVSQSHICRGCNSCACVSGLHVWQRG